MQPASFLCPCCAVSLRVHDHQLVGQTINCPDCDTALVIVGEAQGTVHAEVFVASGTSEGKRTGGIGTHAGEATDAAASVVPSQKPSGDTGPSPDAIAVNKTGTGFPSYSGRNLSAWRQWMRNPVVVAWTLAGTSALLLLLTFVSLNGTSTENNSFRSKQTANNSSEPLSPLSETLREEPRRGEMSNGTSRDKAPAAQTERTDAGTNDQPHVGNTGKDETASVLKAPSPDPKALAVPNAGTAAAEPVPQAHPDVNVDVGAERVRTALAQPIASFEQANPVLFRELLIQVKEMAAVPIEFDEQEIGTDVLDQPISLELQSTTVRSILQELCGQVELTWAIHGSTIWLHKRSLKGSNERATE